MVSAYMLQTRYADVFSQAFRRLAGLDHDDAVVGPSGDSAEMATELTDWSSPGSSLACDYGEGREPTSKPADFVTRRRLPITGLGRRRREAGGNWRTLGRQSPSVNQ